MVATPLSSTTVARSVTDGVNLAAAGVAVDSANDNSFQNDGSTLLRVKNAGGGACTVTVCFAQGNVDGTTIAPLGKQYSVPATTGDRLIGPFPVVTYGTTVTVKYSTGTSVTAYVYQPTN